jgi:hypothetical protein
MITGKISKQLEINRTLLEVVVHVFNPSYLGVEDSRITVQAQPRQTLVRPYLKKQTRDW